MASPADRFPIAVLVSGSGTNLQAILDRVHGRDGIEVVAVASSKPGVRALRRAHHAGVENAVFEAADYPSRVERDIALAGWLTEREVKLVVLGGFLELLGPQFLNHFQGRVMNVHPALLPAFPGPRPVREQLSYGVKVGGVTVHFVDEGIDTGPIILQEAVRLPYTRDPEEVRELLHQTEHKLLPRAIRLFARGAVRFDAENPRFVHVDESVLESD